MTNISEKYENILIPNQCSCGKTSSIPLRIINEKYVSDLETITDNKLKKVLNEFQNMMNQTLTDFENQETYK